MHAICGSVATLAVASIYCVWRHYFDVQLQQHRLLAHRVAQLIWAVAQQPE